MSKPIICCLIMTLIATWAPHSSAENWLCLNPENVSSDLAKVTFSLDEKRERLTFKTSYGATEQWTIDYAGLFPPRSSIYDDSDLNKPRSSVVIASHKKAQGDRWVYSNLILDESTKELQIGYMLVGQVHHWVQGDGRGMMWGGVDGDLKEDMIIDADRNFHRVYRRSNRFYQCNNF